MSSRTLTPVKGQTLTTTRLKPPKLAPPLCVGLFDAAGNLTRIIEQDDPRERFVALWNSRYWGPDGTVARSLSAREVKIGHALLAERTVAHA
jgi:hypothetical protein